MATFGGITEINLNNPINSDILTNLTEQKYTTQRNSEEKINENDDYVTGTNNEHMENDKIITESKLTLNTTSQLKETSETNSNIKKPQEKENIGFDESINKLKAKISYKQGENSTHFINSIGAYFLTVSAEYFNNISSLNDDKDKLLRHKHLRDLICILNDFSHSINQYSPASSIFGKLSLIFKSDLFDNNKIDYNKLWIICKKYFNNLAYSYDIIIKEIEGLYSVIPEINTSILFEE